MMEDSHTGSAVPFVKLVQRLVNNDEKKEMWPNFKSLSLEKKVTFVYEVLGKEGFFPLIQHSKWEKCARKSVKLREFGNIACRMKRNSDALNYYTQSICYAPSNYLELLSLAYAERSDILHYFNDFKHCSDDIDRAFSHGFSQSKLTYKLLGRKGRCLLMMGQYHLAEKCLRETLQAIALESDLSGDMRKATEKSIQLGIEKCISLQNSDICSIDMSGVEEPDTLSCIIRQMRMSDDLLYASESVEPSYSDEYGRHVIATCDIQRGEVLMIESSYISMLNPKHKTTQCYHCFSKCTAFVPCEYCALVKFCSEKCRVQGWDAYHRTECKIFIHMAQLECSENQYLAVRLLTVSTNNGESLQQLYNDIQGYNNKTASEFPQTKWHKISRYYAVHNLETNENKMSLLRLLRRTCEVAIILRIMKEKTDFFTKFEITIRTESNTTEGVEKIDIDDGKSNAIGKMEIDNGSSINGSRTSTEREFSKLTDTEAFVGGLLLRYLCIMHSNPHDIKEAKFRQPVIRIDNAQKGFIQSFNLYPACCLINHSCRPNAVLLNLTNNGMVIATKEIKKDDQIFISYGVDEKTEYMDRTYELLSEYCIKCRCQACASSWLQSETRPKLPKFLTQEEKMMQELEDSLTKILQLD